MQNEKKCSKCHTTKLLSFFSGTQSRCKSCRAEIRRERYQNNRLQELAWTRKSRGVTDPKILSQFEMFKTPEQLKERKEKNRLKALDRAKIRYATDPLYRERILEYKRRSILKARKNETDEERDERRRREAEKSKIRYAADPEYRERVKKNQKAAKIRLLERLKNAT